MVLNAGESAPMEKILVIDDDVDAKICPRQLGGVALGEVMYRTSSAILSNEATGAERFGREIAGLFLNPIRGFNRVITGRAFRVRSNPMDPDDRTPGYFVLSLDAGYRGELTVLLVNLGDEPHAVAVGERIAQLVIVPVGAHEPLEVAELPPSDGRGAGGFGSTGHD